MKKKTQQCQFCKRFFKRTASHEKFCKDKPSTTYAFTDDSDTLPRIYTIRDVQSAERAGREAGDKLAMERVKQQLDSVKIKAIDAAAKAVEAIAHMMGDM